jgi:serine/threonine-protein kinase
MDVRSVPVVSGDVIDGRFRVERVIGSGGMGTVVCAMHLQLRERVAIKFLNAESAKDPEARARFLREARLSARLRNQHVARLMDFGVCDDGTPILVMEYLTGSDLEQRLAKDGPLPVDETVEYLLHASEALAEAHAHGMVHRDVKPSNLFVTQAPDGTPMVKVLDFGISKAMVEEPDDDSGNCPHITDRFAVVGSPSYMSPEQVCGQALDARSDVWSLGMLLYEMLTGTAPFDRGSLAETFAAVLNQEPAPLRELRADAPQELETLAQWCMVKTSGERCPDVGAFADALVAAAPLDARRVQCERIKRLAHTVSSDSTPPVPDHEGVVGTSVTWKHTRHVTQHRSRKAIVAAFSLLVVGAVTAIFSWWSRPRVGTDPAAVSAARGESTNATPAVSEEVRSLAPAPGTASMAAGSPAASASADILKTAVPTASAGSVASSKQVAGRSRPPVPASSSGTAPTGASTNNAADPLDRWDPVEDRP